MTAVVSPTVSALSFLSMDPSPAVAAAVQQAAGTRHGLVNLTRLVQALDRQSRQAQRGEWLTVQKTWESVVYARALLVALRSTNEGASTTSTVLTDLEKTLSRVESNVQATAQQTRAPAPTTSLPLFELPATALVVPTEAALLDDDEGGALAVLKDADSADEDASAAAVPAAISALASDELVLPELEMPAAKPTPLLSPSVTVASGTFSTEGYFTRRSREDTQGGEAGLLPLKVKKETVGEEVLDQEGMRRRLLGDAGAGMGAAQLHEELGGQLVDMSRQLKKNALHFSNQLAEEKTLLESAQGALEKNVDGTMASKGKLATVSTKSRGTTCMTIGIVVLVIVLFIWTYLLIKFT